MEHDLGKLENIMSLILNIPDNKKDMFFQTLHEYICAIYKMEDMKEDDSEDSTKEQPMSFMDIMKMKGIN